MQIETKYLQKLNDFIKEEIIDNKLKILSDSGLEVNYHSLVATKVWLENRTTSKYSETQKTFISMIHEFEVDGNKIILELPHPDSEIYHIYPYDSYSFVWDEHEGATVEVYKEVEDYGVTTLLNDSEIDLPVYFKARNRNLILALAKSLSNDKLNALFEEAKEFYPGVIRFERGSTSKINVIFETGAILVTEISDLEEQVFVATENKKELN